MQDLLRALPELSGGVAAHVGVHSGLRHAIKVVCLVGNNGGTGGVEAEVASEYGLGEGAEVGHSISKCTK